MNQQNAKQGKRVRAPKPNNLSSTSRSYTVDGEPTPPSCSLTSRRVYLNECVHKINKCIFLFFF